MKEPIDPQCPENAQPPAQHASSLPALTEDQALARLKQRNLPIESVEEIVRNAGLMKSRNVRILLAAHPCAPRRVALRLIREFYTFDLMQFALRPGTPADLRRFADELLISRVASITLGECISLARRSSEMVAGALLVHQETAVWRAALQNPRLTERAIIKALSRTDATSALVEFLSRDPKWASRAPKSGSPCCEILILRQSKQPNSHENCQRPNYAMFCIHRACRKQPRNSYGKSFQV